MCGGELVCAPCSHVGHIFRATSPYDWTNSHTTNPLRHNTIRLAEVWLDQFKHFFYERFNYDLREFGDVSERRALRRSLNCKSFAWYLENVFPEQSRPDESLFYGEVRNEAFPKLCLDSDGEVPGKSVIGYECHGQGGPQVDFIFFFKTLFNKFILMI
jgi:polypeptide N-acetylgalactosaminyltransferase